MFLVIVAGWWLPSLPDVYTGPRAAPICLIDADDQDGINSILERAEKWLSRWPVSEIEFVVREELSKRTYDDMKKRITIAYNEWFSPTHYKQYLERNNYVIHEGTGNTDQGSISTGEYNNNRPPPPEDPPDWEELID